MYYQLFLYVSEMVSKTTKPLTVTEPSTTPQNKG